VTSEWYSLARGSKNLDPLSWTCSIPLSHRRDARREKFRTKSGGKGRKEFMHINRRRRRGKETQTMHIAHGLDFHAHPPEGGYITWWVRAQVYYAYIITMCSRAIVEFEREIEFILRWIWFIQRIGVVVSEVHCCDWPVITICHAAPGQTKRLMAISPLWSHILMYLRPCALESIVRAANDQRRLRHQGV
jgi:hypothetical protein